MFLPHPPSFRDVYLNDHVWKVHFGHRGQQVVFPMENCTELYTFSPRLAPALHFSSRNFSSSQGSLEKSGESTLNQEEVDKFRAMSRSTPLIFLSTSPSTDLCSTWWDPKGVCRPLHSMNRLRVPLVREGLLQVPKWTKPSPTFTPISFFLFQEGTLSEAYMETDKPLTGLKLLDVGY